MSIRSTLDLDTVCASAPVWADQHGDDWASAWRACENGAWLIWTVACLGKNRGAVLDVLEDVIDSDYQRERLADLRACNNGEHLSDREFATRVSNVIVEPMVSWSRARKAEKLRTIAQTIRTAIDEAELLRLVAAQGSP